MSVCDQVNQLKAHCNRDVTEQKDSQVGDGQWEEVAICGRVHRRVAYDDDADGDVAHDARDEDQNVDDCYGHDNVHRQMLGAPVSGEISIHVPFTVATV